MGLPRSQALLPAELSGGMRKRVGVARAIALEPRAILYDEPTTGLDPANQNRIGELIVALQRRLRITSVVVTHELELCFAISNRVALLKDGRIAAAGTRRRDPELAAARRRRLPVRHARRVRGASAGCAARKRRGSDGP